MSSTYSDEHHPCFARCRSSAEVCMQSEITDTLTNPGRICQKTAIKADNPPAVRLMNRYSRRSIVCECICAIAFQFWLTWGWPVDHDLYTNLNPNKECDYYPEQCSRHCANSRVAKFCATFDIHLVLNAYILWASIQVWRFIYVSLHSLTDGSYTARVPRNEPRRRMRAE
jgi:hypothetical protein